MMHCITDGVDSVGFTLTGPIGIVSLPSDSERRWSLLMSVYEGVPGTRGLSGRPDPKTTDPRLVAEVLKLAVLPRGASHKAIRCNKQRLRRPK